MVISYSSTFEYFSSSFFHLCISEEKKKKKKKSLKTQSNDHRVVTRGQKVLSGQQLNSEKFILDYEKSY